MRFPRGFGGGIDMQKTEWLIMEAINGGVNYFDTAYIYGGSEEALGTILEKNKARERVYIATKLPLVMLKGPADFDKFFNKELERLRTDYIDYYLMHMLTDRDMWETLKSWGIEEWIAEKKKAGQIKQVGFSFHGSQEEFLRLLEVYPWEFCQIQYNYTGETYQAGTVGLEKAAAMDLPVIIMEPLLGGKLAVPPPRAAAIFKQADPDRSPADWALRWVWDHPEATVLLSGMNDPRQLEENLAIADKAQSGKLTGAEKDVYNQVLEVFNASYKIRCTGCNYCMPCPRNVNIPGCFAAYNTSFSLGWVAGMQQYATSATLISTQSGSATNCIKCCKCEGHCPQHLPIRQALAQVRGRMEPPLIHGGIAIARAFLGRKNKKA
jgi:predicted aldo/keto reductase-like oxidoreductase